MSFTTRFKLVNKESGTVHDFLMECQTPEEAIALEIALSESGFQPFKTVQVQSTPAAPQNNGSAPVEPDAAKPGDLHSRFQVAVIEVEPQASGNAKVSFYGDDKIQPMNKYPYASNTYKPETWVKKFADVCPFEVEHFKMPARYAVRADVEVRYGKPNTQGNLYKNVAAIYPAVGVGTQEVTTYEATKAVEPDEVPF